MSDDDRTLVTADEIAAWIERLWRTHANRRVGCTARMVRYAVRTRGLPAERDGRTLIASAAEVTAWWLRRRGLSPLS